MKLHVHVQYNAEYDDWILFIAENVTLTQNTEQFILLYMEGF